MSALLRIFFTSFLSRFWRELGPALQPPILYRGYHLRESSHVGRRMNYLHRASLQFHQRMLCIKRENNFSKYATMLISLLPRSERYNNRIHAAGAEPQLHSCKRSKSSKSFLKGLVGSRSKRPLAVGRRPRSVSCAQPRWVQRMGRGSGCETGEDTLGDEWSDAAAFQVRTRLNNIE